MATRVLIVGVSTRGLAESAARAGYEVAAVDGFGDLDLRACARVVRVARAAARFSARAAVAAARDLACDAVVYQASLDNDPDAVRTLARGRELWGNRPAVLERVRDPRLVARVVAAAGLPGPLVRLARPAGALGTAWLLKPLRSGGGEAIRPWRHAEPVPRGTYLQQRIGGVAGSIVFVADGRRAVPLGMSRILAGERAFGAHGFRYCGNILGAAGDGQLPGDSALVTRATRLARAVTAAFGLVGVNGIDFVAQRGMPYAIEVNPRYTAAMELVERAYGLSIFDVHVRACAGALPVFDFEAVRRRAQGAVGKAILYARRPLELGDATAWLEQDVRDISPPGTRFAPRDPICTVFAHGVDASACHAALVRRAAELYRGLEDRKARIA